MVLPLELLEASLNKAFALTLKDGRSLRGTLVGFDPYLNLVLQDAKEELEGQDRDLGTIILRGHNVVTVALT